MVNAIACTIELWMHERSVRVARGDSRGCSSVFIFRLRSDLSRKINTEVHPVFTCRKIKDERKAKEPKPPIVNQQMCVICVMQIMSALQADTYINVWRNTNDR